MERENTPQGNILDNYDLYRKFILEETELVLKGKKRYIQTNSIGSITKLFNLDQMIDLFYLEEEHEIVQELNELKKAIMVKHFLRDQISDI
ncbi:MAG: hypothetical protein EBW68_09505 [Actinobacteria bacterium]|jgi:hypothetical protein|nr:hypothetical protein [Actinomycetota bacterium]